MTTSTILSMLLVAAGSGALALTLVRGLVLVFPRARETAAIEPAASASFRMRRA